MILSVLPRNATLLSLLEESMNNSKNMEPPQKKQQQHTHTHNNNKLFKWQNMWLYSESGKIKKCCLCSGRTQRTVTTAWSGGSWLATTTSCPPSSRTWPSRSSPTWSSPSSHASCAWVCPLLTWTLKVVPGQGQFFGDLGGWGVERAEGA